MRGKNFDDAFVVLDEAQNCTHMQLKMFLTRIGEHSRVVINGDTEQSDICNKSGLREAALRLTGLTDVYIHEFEAADVVRSVPGAQDTRTPPGRLIVFSCRDDKRSLWCNQRMRPRKLLKRLSDKILADL